MPWRLLPSPRRLRRSRSNVVDAAPVRSIDVASVLDRLCHRYPSGLVDAVLAVDPGRRLTALKNVTANEHFFPGHFPEVPLMPGVLVAVLFLGAVAAVATMTGAPYIMFPELAALS